MSFAVGSTVGGYEIVGFLGAGGMGEVYQVRNSLTGRVDAMKVLLANLEASGEFAQRFVREMRVQAQLAHPNIAQLHTAFQHQNRLVMVLEFIEGRSLHSLLREGRLTPAAAIDIARQSLRALDYAHGQGIIHRDIKPANIMVSNAGVVKLMDFGIARAISEESLTRTGDVLGSLHYMSPEQITGTASVDRRSDLYSLGVVMYQMTTGRRPFEGATEYAVMKAHLEEAPAPPHEVDPSVAPELSQAILRALEKDPAARYLSASEFLARLEGFRAAGSAAEPARRSIPDTAGPGPVQSVGEPFPRSATAYGEARVPPQDRSPFSSSTAGPSTTAQSRRPQPEPWEDSGLLRGSYGSAASEDGKWQISVPRPVLFGALAFVVALVGWLLLRSPQEPRAGEPSATAETGEPAPSSSAQEKIREPPLLPSHDRQGSESAPPLRQPPSSSSVATANLKTEPQRAALSTEAVTEPRGDTPLSQREESEPLAPAASSSSPPDNPPPPVAPPRQAPPTRIQVGGAVQKARLTKQASPVYPLLARQARIQGTVALSAVIGKDGAISKLEVISGHPLLVPAAMKAVSEWVYKPTLLNGTAVEVLTQIDVNFTLTDSEAPAEP